MTNSDRWRIIAEAFDTPREKRTLSQTDLTSYGLCYAWMSLTDASPVALWTFFGRCAFIARIRSRRGDAIRATLAGLFAAMTERERREVLT